MGKKKSNAQTTKAAAKAAKKARATQKTERKVKKKQGKAKDEFDDDQDLEAILENIRREWEDSHVVIEELVEGPPSRRANATLTACPSGDHLWCIGGEFFSQDGKAYFYSDVFRYTPEKDEWRKFVSPTCPGPRSAHAVVPSPAGGGKLFLFGGEFSSLYQNTFHHYRDFWCFDITTRSWDRIESKVRPSARSGHRMALWKHYIVLFGGFYDPGIATRYMNDLWVFDTQEYKWQQIEYKDPNERRPSPRSGFSFLSTPDGIVLHGGYCKEYAKGKRPVGIMLDDTWLLRLSLAPAPEGTSGKTKFDPLVAKWERRKRPSTAYAPAQRSGSTMALWATKGMGVLFGGVTDEDSDEETLKSVFWNDLNGYQFAGNGRWVSMMLKAPKKKGGKRKKEAPREDDEDEAESAAVPESELEPDPEDPLLSTPMPRYNAMLAVLRNTLYIYGGIFERGSREYTLDDFYALALDKMDRYVCLKKSDIIIPEGDEESSSSEEDDDGGDSSEDDEDDEDEDDSEMLLGNGEAPEIKDPRSEIAEEPKASLRDQATAFMGVSKDTKRSEEDIISTPLPGETLAIFYARSRHYWAQKARESSDNRGKLLRRDGFSLAEEHYGTYKPILEEVEKILSEAGLDEEEMKRASATGQAAGTGQSRNRR